MNTKKTSMHIHVLGTRGEIKSSAPYHARHSGVLIDNTLLFDLGEQDFVKHEPRAIFITHLHPDHAYFVRAGSSRSTTANIPIYAPEEYPGAPLTVCTRTIVIGDYTITPIPTEHSIHVLSQAYLIEKGSLRILYTGDMLWIDKKYHAQLHNLDLVITEGSHIKKGGLIRRHEETGKVYGHAGIPDLIHFFKPFTKHFLLAHFGSWFYTDGAVSARRQIHKIARENQLQIDIGYDGMQMKLTKIW